MCGIHVCHTAPSITGWRRLMKYLAWLIHMCDVLQVVFCKRATNYRALLQKMTYKDKAPCDSRPPCTHSYMSCDLFICVATLKHMCETTQSHEWQHSNTCVTWRNPTCGMHVSHSTFLAVCSSRVWEYDTWHCLGFRDDTCVWHDAIIRVACMCVTWLIHICHVTYSYVRQHSIICVASRNHTCGIHVCHTAPPRRFAPHLFESLTRHIVQGWGFRVSGLGITD